jgi:hypothetical protein
LLRPQFIAAALCSSNGFAKPEDTLGLIPAHRHGTRMSLILLIPLSLLHSNNAQPCCSSNILAYLWNSSVFFSEILLNSTYLRTNSVLRHTKSAFMRIG